MNWRINFRNICLLLLMVVMTACSANETGTPVGEMLPTDGSLGTQAAIDDPAGTQTATVPTATFDTTTTQVPAVTDGAPPAGEAGLCNNTYFPVVDGATWTYQSTGGPVGSYGFTDTITSVRDDGFTLTSQFDELTRTQEWGCTREGLVALQLGGTSAATLNSQEMQVNLDVSNVSGISFPSSVEPGDTWQHALEFTGSMVVGGQEIEANGSAQSTFTAIGMESVTVPAGTFNAMKVRVDSTINITGVFQGVSLPLTITSPYDYWFAPGVGWVKASGTGDVAGQSFTESIELQSYNIP
jgi:hypothetical protein